MAPQCLSGKGSPAKCRRHRRHGFSPWVRKIPWGRKWQPIPAFLAGEFHGQRSLVGYSPWGHTESDTTDRLITHITAPQFCMSFCCTMKWVSFLKTYIPTPLFYVIKERRAEPLVLYVDSHCLSISHMIVYLCHTQPPNSSHPPLPALCPQVSSLHLHLYSCPETRFIRTIFLDSTCMH